MGLNDRKQDQKEDKRGKQLGFSTVDDGWKGFVNYELDGQQKEEVRKLFDKYPDAWSWLQGRVFEGYKLTMSYDGAHTTWNVSLTCKVAGSINAGLTLTGRGGGCQAACVALWYKDTVGLGGSWNSVRSTNGRGLEIDDVG